MVCVGFAAPLNGAHATVCLQVAAPPAAAPYTAIDAAEPWAPALRTVTARLQAAHTTPALVQSIFRRAQLQVFAEGGACIPPAGAERLPAGLSPTPHPPRMPMSERRGRRRTRLNVMLHHRAHSAMRRSRNVCPAPRHEQNRLYRTQLTVSHQKRLMILYSVSRCAASLPAPSMSRTIFLVDMS